MSNREPKAGDGGYCPMCDTVWCHPGRCNCAQDAFGKAGMEVLMKPFIPLTDREAEIHNYAYEKAWNEAIEAAMKAVEDCIITISDANTIAIKLKGLKK